MKKPRTIIGRIPAVVLSPDDMRIIAGDHSERRRFLDLLLSMLYPAYFSALQHYHRALKMRSQLLKTRPDESVLAAIDRELASSGVQILEKRRQFIPNLRHLLLPMWRRFPLKKMSGKSCTKVTPKRSKTSTTTWQMLRDRRAERPAAQADHERHSPRPGLLSRRAATQTGRFATVGSQGQKRTAALALKTAQFSYMRAKLGATPVLLIDDILNELDLSRRASFIDFLGGGDVGQVFFTTTDLVGMQDFLTQMEKSAAVQNITL
jgi:DNA replication and repair protein RecF